MRGAREGDGGGHRGTRKIELAIVPLPNRAHEPEAHQAERGIPDLGIGNKHRNSAPIDARQRLSREIRQSGDPVRTGHVAQFGTGQFQGERPNLGDAGAREGSLEKSGGLTLQANEIGERKMSSYGNGYGG